MDNLWRKCRREALDGNLGNEKDPNLEAIP